MNTNTTGLYKYPHTPYLPWSPSIDPYDPVIDESDLIGRDVVVTEKMDGENTTLYRAYMHARSFDDDHHFSKDWLKNYWYARRYTLPETHHICGENLYITHSIHYGNLKSYFLGFSAWCGPYCFDWDETLTIFKDCDIMPVPVIYRGVYDRARLQGIFNNTDTTKHEGYVVRIDEPFYYDDFGHYVAKCVRPQHVQSTKHWRHQAMLLNSLEV